MDEYLSSMGVTLPEEPGESRLALVMESLDKCPSLPATPCSVNPDTVSTFDEQDIPVTCPTNLASCAVNCLAGFHNVAEYVEDTTALHDEIEQLDMTACGNKVAE